MTASDVRVYAAAAKSTDVFGRVLCSARDQHLVVDGPAGNGCPGEAISPAEIFLGGVATCGVELIQVLARQARVPLSGIGVEIQGFMDRANPVRPDVTLFNRVQIDIALKGVSQQQADDLVQQFRGR